MLSAFEFDAGGHAQIEMVNSVDGEVERRADAIAIKDGQGERRMAGFRVDPRLAVPGDRRFLVVEYLDRGTGRWFVENDCQNAKQGALHSWSTSSKTTLHDSGQWRRVTLELDAPRWTGSLDNADFRIVVLDHTAPEFLVRSLYISGHAAARRDDLACRYVRPSMDVPLRLAEPDSVSASIVIPVFNRLEYTLECLHAVMEYTPSIYEVIVVDNGSTDGSGMRLAGVPGLRLLTRDCNEGFARACNAGAEAARGNSLVFLNNDTIPQPGWLTAITAAMDRNPDVRVVGSRLIYPHSGAIQHAGVSFDAARLPHHDFEHFHPDDDAVSVDREVDAVTGACLGSRRDDFLALGGFDDRFWNGFEDIDYCLRVRKAGGKVLYCARSTLLHYKSASTGRVNEPADKANIRLFRDRWDEFIASGLPARPVPANAGKRTNRAERRLLRQDCLPYRIDLGSGRIRSQTGEREAGSITCRAGEHPRGHCVYGGFVEVGEALSARAEFLVQVARCPGRGKPLAVVDIYDCAADRVLSHGVLKDLGEDMPLSRCAVPFSANPGQILEFRVFWRGACDLTVAGIDLVAE